MSEEVVVESRITSNRANLVVFSAVAMLVAGLGFMIVEAVVASAWTSPPYSYVYDQLPDLGNPTCGPFQNRVICSPHDGLMNAMFVVHGSLFAFAGILLSRLMAGTARAAVFVLALVYVIGLSMITVFHQYAGMPAIVEDLNITGAFLGILSGSIIAIIFGSQRRRLHLPPWPGPQA
jgi:xanthine/uracil permease